MTFRLGEGGVWTSSALGSPQLRPWDNDLGIKIQQLLHFIEY